MDVKDVTNAAKHQQQVQPARDTKSQEKKPERSVKPSQKAQGDEVTISPAAKEKSKIARYTEIVKNMPDVRDAEVARVKDNMEKGLYTSPDVRKKTAEKMLEE